jgi:uncharacterized protein (DUF2235 family)
MSKNIVILLDGTSNEIDADRTNVLRLFGCLERSDNQLVYYDPGVGTFGAERAWFRPWRQTVEVFGLATGWGIDENVLQAYEFLIRNYQKGIRDENGARVSDDDRIYIFGFSRGAYTARILAGFIHALGVIAPENLNLMDYAYRTYKGLAQESERDSSGDPDTDDPNQPWSAFGKMRLYEKTLNTYRPAIKLLGLFDTVASVIEWGRYWPKLTSHAFTKRNRSVEYVRHAMAIDERRTMFRPLHWFPGQEYWGSPFRPKPASKIKPQDFKEVWFAGCHGDVGGGYPEKDSALAKLALEWMVDETRGTGLFYDQNSVDYLLYGLNAKSRTKIPPDPLGPLHDSMTWAWKILEYIPRKRPDTTRTESGEPRGWFIPMSRPRAIPENAMVHRSVQTRMNGQPQGGPYRPPNLPGSPHWV